MGLGCFFEPSPLRFKFFFREDNQEHEENKSQDAYKDFQEIGRRSLCARGHVPHDQQIVVAAAQAFDGKIPVLADGIVFFSQAPIGVMEEPRDLASYSSVSYSASKASLSAMGSSGHSSVSVKYTMRFSRSERGTFSRAACSAVCRTRKSLASRTFMR